MLNSSYHFDHVRMSQYVSDSDTATQLVCLLVPFIQQSVLKSQVCHVDCMGGIKFTTVLVCDLGISTAYFTKYRATASHGSRCSAFR